MNTKVFYTLLTILLLLPLALIGWFWNAIPDTIPLHYNINMEPDRWGPKGSIFIVPGIAFFVVALLLVVPKIDPKRNIERYLTVYRSIILGTVIFTSGLVIMELFKHIGYNVPNNYIPLAVIVLIAFMGNLMLKLKPSYFVGIRTPWTLENEEVWRRTHRLGGYIWVFASLVMLPVVLLTPAQVYGTIFIGYAAIIAVVPIVYSAWVYFKLKNENT